MGWTLSGLASDIAQAWAPANLPYTVGFWLVVAVVAWLLNRRSSARADRD